MAPSAARHSHATPTPSNHVAVPKAFTDKLLQQQARISALEGIVYDLRDQFRDYKADVETQMDELDNENRQLWDRVNELEEQQERSRDTVQRVVDFIDNSDIERTNKPIESKPKPQKSKATRDNIFNRCAKFSRSQWATLQTVALDALALEVPVKAGGSYIADPNSRGNILRPDWKVGFSENSRWHPQILAFTREKASIFHPAMNLEMLKAKSDDDIMERVEGLFKNIADKFRSAQRAKKTETSGEGDDDAGETKNPRQINHRGTRKVRKCDEHLEAFLAAHKSVPDECKWFFQPVYQSTNESNNSAVLDPDTELESDNEIHVSATNKPWLSRAPMYRVEEEWVLSVDDLVMAARQQSKKLKRNRTEPHARNRGEWKDKGLPMPGAENPKITCTAIQPEWLEANPEFDVPSCIQEEGYEADNE
ncbi:hypothetical protein B0H14DRAFT_3487159 [Mycena olivaceomarginata]|nr:hypothetical protein B0H14DRAFT_3487159 [Mycena olivaceomarginata]